MVGVALAVPFSEKFGKKSTYMLSFAALILFSALFFYIPISQGGYFWMLILQVVISIFTGVISPLVWSMYADVSDFAENRDGTASTGLIFSSASMAQKFGGAFGGFAVMWLLKAFGYNTSPGAVQTPEAINGLWLLMSWIPAAVAGIAVIVIFFYPLTRSRMCDIRDALAVKRENDMTARPRHTGDRGVLVQSLEGAAQVMRWVLVILAVILALELMFVFYTSTCFLR